MALVIEKPGLLLVEGDDEYRYFRCLLAERGITDVQVHDVRGKGNYPENIRTLKNAPGYVQVRVVGVVKDIHPYATQDAALASVKDALSNAGLPAPIEVGVFVPGPPRVGVLLMPPAGDGVGLEDLCLATVADDPVMQCVDDYMRCLCGRGGPHPQASKA
jgi:hypothetical protein